MASEQSRDFEVTGGYGFGDRYEIIDPSAEVFALSGSQGGAWEWTFDDGQVGSTHLEISTGFNLTSEGMGLTGVVRMDMAQLDGSTPGEYLYLAYEGTEFIEEGAKQTISIAGNFVGGTGRYAGASGTLEATSVNGFIDGGTGELVTLESEQFVLGSSQEAETIDNYVDDLDLLVLPEGLTYDDLGIVDSGSNTIVNVRDTEDSLATLVGINADLIDAQDFAEAEISASVPNDLASSASEESILQSSEELEAAEASNTQTIDAFLAILTESDNQAASDFLDSNFTQDGTFIFIEEEQPYSAEGGSDLERVLPLAGDANGLDETKAIVDEFLTEFNIEDLKIDAYIAEENQVGVSAEVTLENARTGGQVTTPLFIETIFDEQGQLDNVHFFMDSFSVAATSSLGIEWDRVHSGEQLRGILGSYEGDTLEPTNDFLTLIRGLGGNDTINGSSLDDTLYGDGGDDLLNGRASNDFLWGNSGNDTLIGESGRDTFVIAEGDGIDTITDFVAGEDIIGLFGGLDFESLNFVAEGDSVIIEAVETEERLAILAQTVVEEINLPDNFTIVSESDTTDIDFVEDPVAARLEQSSISLEDEARNADVVERYFDSLIDASFPEFISENFASDSVYRVINDDNDPDNPLSDTRQQILPFTRLHESPEGAIGFLDELTAENTTTLLETDNIIGENQEFLAIGRFGFINKYTGNTIGEPPLAAKLTVNEEGKIEEYLFMENTFSFLHTSRLEAKWTTTYGGEVRDIVFGSYEDDEYFGGEEIDELYGYAGDDLLRGGENDDLLRGGNGNDEIDGQAGNDDLYGDGGRDTFVLAANSGTDTVFDYLDGFDRLALSSGLTFEELTLTENDGGTDISVTESGEILASLIGVEVASLDANDFDFAA